MPTKPARQIAQALRSVAGLSHPSGQDGRAPERLLCGWGAGHHLPAGLLPVLVLVFLVELSPAIRPTG